MKKQERYVWQGVSLVTHFFAHSEPEFSSTHWRQEFEKQFPDSEVSERTTETVASDLLRAFIKEGIVVKKSNNWFIVPQWPTAISIDSALARYVEMKDKNRKERRSQCVISHPQVDASKLRPHPLKNLLIKAKITQRQLSSLLGVLRLQISKWLDMTDVMPPDVEKRIMRALNLMPTSLPDAVGGFTL